MIKDFKTISQQVEILKNKGLIIDDIDKAEVMLFVSTGVIKPKYMWLATAVLAMWATGIVLIKKYVL